jgi:hypothetical protein
MRTGQRNPMGFSARLVVCALLLLPLVLLARPAAAQLDASCMVSALNRTAPVDAQGAWILPNVPSNLGQIRVRATCVRSGVTTSGSSGLFTVPPNGVIRVADISFQNPTRVPASLALTAPTVSLTTKGQTVQLAAQAAYSDGSVADVTAVGTDFRTSNAAIASIDASGLVTAQASGTVLLSALNEGALAVLRVQVALSGSGVGDGIPDDWKIAHGLDPHDPNVAFEDPDNDGLTNLEEYQNGTDPHNPDTDGDGLSDGDEVHIYHTNPLLWDTDGDGISDGVEIATGSNPLDIHSFNLAQALRSITVSPAAFGMVFNLVDRQSSRQLYATGNVIDGRTIDMFRPLYGTSLSSSNLAVVNFGPEPGRVYAGETGSATVTVSNAGHSAAASVTVRTFSPTSLAFLPLTGFANAVDVTGNTAYVAAGSAGLYVVDVSDLAAPRVASQLALPGNANDVRVAGGVAYVAAGSAVLTVDVSAPASPARLGSLAVPGNAVRLAVSGTLVYVADMAFGLRVIDAGNPAQPREIGLLALAGTPRAVSLGGPGAYALVACGDQGLAVVDVSRPSSPLLVGSTPPGLLRAGSVTARGHYAYVATGESAVFGGLHVVELADPANPVEVGATPDFFGVTRLAVEDNFALGAQFFEANYAPIFDIGSLPPLHPTDLVLSDLRGPERGSDIALRQGAVFVTANRDLADFGAIGYFFMGLPYTGLYTGLYRLPMDAGTNLPTVSITAPPPGATVRERVPVTLTANATDEVLLTKVRFLVDGDVVDTLYGPPFQTRFTVPTGQPTLTLSAVATGISGLEGTAEEVLNVQPYPLPVASLLAPVSGLTLLDGQPLVIAADASDAVAVTKLEFYINGQLVGTLAAPPYRLVAAYQPGQTVLEVTAIPYDALGPGETAAAEVLVIPNTPPTVAVFSPRDAAQAVEGTVVPVVAGATAANSLASVHFFVNGADVDTQTTPPFVSILTMPPAGQTLLIHVLAIDRFGLQSATPDLTLRSISDPLTTVGGRVVDPNGGPVTFAAVTVTTQGSAAATAISGADGSFTVPGLPTIEGSLTVTVRATLGSCPAQAILNLAVPAAGENADVGNIMLTSASRPTVTTVTGTVLGTDGQGLAGVTVSVASIDLGDSATTTSGAGGVFAVTGFPARLWNLRAEATINVGGVMLSGASSGSVVPAAGGTTSLGSIQLQPYPFTGSDPLTTVNGLVLNDDGSPAAGATVTIDVGYAVLTTTAASDGTFSLGGVPTLQGSLYVAASSRLNCAVYHTAGPLFVNQLVAGGVTDVGTLTLVPDNGPPVT